MLGGSDGRTPATAMGEIIAIEVDHIFLEKGVIIIPDFLCNATVFAHYLIPTRTPKVRSP